MELNTVVKPPRRALALWRIRAVLLTFFPAFICSLFLSFDRLLWAIGTATWVVGFLYFFYFWYPIKWKKLSFCLTNKILYINNGVVYTHRRFIHLENIQYVEMYQSPFMKLAGLTSVVIKAPGASMYIPSLWKEDAQALYEALTTACLAPERKEDFHG